MELARSLVLNPRKSISLLGDGLVVAARIRRLLPAKHFGELVWWYRHLHSIVAWHELRAAPDRVAGYGPFGNASIAWLNAHNKYPSLLRLTSEYFEGRRVLDVGCGPIPWALAFTGCEIYGLDPLADCFRRLGFPLDEYSDRFRYVCSSAERMPFDDDFFDAVISVNALDHVDDLAAVAREVSRVVRPEGILRFNIHRHRPTRLEPWSVDDNTVVRHFGHLGVAKVDEWPYPEFKPDPEGAMVVWGNSE